MLSLSTGGLGKTSATFLLDFTAFLKHAAASLSCRSEPANFCPCEWSYFSGKMRKLLSQGGSVTMLGMIREAGTLNLREQRLDAVIQSKCLLSLRYARR